MDVFDQAEKYISDETPVYEVEKQFILPKPILVGLTTDVSYSETLEFLLSKVQGGVTESSLSELQSYYNNNSFDSEYHGPKTQL